MDFIVIVVVIIPLVLCTLSAFAGQSQNNEINRIVNYHVDKHREKWQAGAEGRQRWREELDAKIAKYRKW